MAESETGPRSSRKATSIMAVTAKRLLVLKRMLFFLSAQATNIHVNILSNLHAN
jgi:hypothetical protein